MASWVDSLDAYIVALLSDWSVVTTLLAVTVAGLALYPFFFPEEADIHPLLLARQAATSPVRNKGESAIYRSPEVPHGYPLKTGLNVKDASQPRWSSGRDGDLRDIWRTVQLGGTKAEDGKTIPKGLIMTVLGKQEIDEHDVEQLSKEINILGKHLQSSGEGKVGIYLSNSIEYLLTIFACSFYGLTPVLLPYNLPHPRIYELVNEIGVGSLVCAAGTVPLDDLAKQCQKLRRLTWVVEKTSRQMDWNGSPKGAEGRLSVSVWHEIVENSQSSASAQLPDNKTGAAPGDVVFVWQPTAIEIKPDIVTLTQGNLVSATAALLSAIPLRQRLSSADLVLPADTFTHSYVLCQTFAALMAHASVAINSVALPGVDLALARRGIAPTVIIASAETLASLHAKETSGINSGLQRFGKYSQAQTMSAGRMPTDGILFRLLAPSASSNEPGKLRLIFVSERIGAGSPPLTSTMLSDLRIFARARIVYALTTSRVAGAVAQSNVFDYRRDDGIAASHFGIPLSSVEIKLLNGANDGEVSGSQPKGELQVTGPAVSGGQVRLGVQLKVRGDGTIAYA